MEEAKPFSIWRRPNLFSPWMFLGYLWMNPASWGQVLSHLRRGQPALGPEFKLVEFPWGPGLVE